MPVAAALLDDPSPTVARGRYGMAVRRHGPDSPQAKAALAVLAEAKCAAAIRETIDEHGPLPTEAVERLSALLAEGHDA